MNTIQTFETNTVEWKYSKIKLQSLNLPLNTMATWDLVDGHIRSIKQIEVKVGSTAHSRSCQHTEQWASTWSGITIFIL